MSRRRRGAALILVVVVIAALLAISAPFVVSMRLHEQSARAFHADVRARQLAETARNRALGHLMRTHPDEERRAREARSDLSSDDEGHDDIDELTPPESPLVGLRPADHASPRGEMAQVEVADARARIDLNACGPDPIANLLGVTVTTEVIAYEGLDPIPVEDASRFYTDGDPETVDGVVKINHEYLCYKDVVWLPPLRTGEPRRPALVPFNRGAYFSYTPEPEDADLRRDYHPAGSLVQDGRGWKVADDALWRYVGTEREGQLARFEGPAAIRRIADWLFITSRAAAFLGGSGVNLSRLRAWGITSDALLDAGIDPATLGDDEDETPEEKELRQEAERKLGLWGISVEALKRFGGAKAVLRAHAQLSALEGDPRKALIERYKERADKLEERTLKVDAWVKDEVKRQLKDLSERREHGDREETIGRIELEERIRPFMTTDSPAVGEAWSEPQVVTHRIEFEPYQTRTRIKLQDPRRFMADMIVRVQLRDRSRPPEFRFCRGVRRDEAVFLDPQLDFEYEAGSAEVSCRLPAPININSARREVLQAVLTGLMSRVGQVARARRAPEMVTPREARAIAEAIIADAPANFAALRATLLELEGDDVISAHDVDAVYRNGVDPADALLLRSSVPFCFTSGDVYELTATGIVNDPAGLEVGRRRFREAVRVAPPRDLVWTIDSQWDFSDRIYVGGPLGPGVPPDPRSGGTPWLALPHAWSNLLQTQPVLHGPYVPIAYQLPSQSHAPGEGDIQPLLSREPETGAGTTSTPNYADDPPTGGPAPGRLFPLDQALNDLMWNVAPDGIPLQQVPVDQRPMIGTRHFQWQDGTPCATVGPGAFRAWLRMDRQPGYSARYYVFDGGRANGIDNLSLYFDGPRELVLSLDDEALDIRESQALGVAPRATELRLPLPRPVQADNWYHVAAFWKGTEPNDLLLMVDGKAGGKVNLGSRLTQQLDSYGGIISVEDASSFPPQGFVRVGGYRWSSLPTRRDRGLGNNGEDANDTCEVLYYSQKSGNNLLVGAPRVDEVQDLLAAGATITNIQPRPQGNVPTNARRPQRGSGTQHVFTFSVPGARNPVTRQVALGFPHAVGTTVVPYGYHSKVHTDSNVGLVRRGERTLTHPLPRNTPATVLYAAVPGYTLVNATTNPMFDPYPEIVNATSNQIPILWAATSDPAFTGALPPRPPPGAGGQVQTNPPVGIEAYDPNKRAWVGGWPPMGIVRITSNKTPRTGTPIQSVERVLYRGIAPDGSRLLNCVRGIEGTTASSHFLWDTVVLESIVVDGQPDDYPTRAAIGDPRVYVSLTHDNLTATEYTEWLSVQTVSDPTLKAQGFMLIPARDSFSFGVQAGRPPRTSDPGDLPGFPYEYDLMYQMLRMNGSLGATPGLLTVFDPLAYDFGHPFKEVLKRWEVSYARACKGTGKPAQDRPTPAGVKVVSTFATLDPYESGHGDIVTLADDQGPVTSREEQRLVHGALAIDQASPGMILAGINADSVTGWLTATDDFPSRQYDGRARARLARWPTGNLHSLPQALTLGQARPPAYTGEVVQGAPGVLDANADDLSSHQLLVRLDRIMALDAQSTTALIQEDAQDLRRGQLYRVGDEVLAVVDAQPAPAPQGQQGTWSSATVLRGALGTTPHAHGDTFAWKLYWPAHAVAQGGFAGARGQFIPIDGARGDFRTADGYVAIDRGPGSHPRWAEQPFLAVLPFAARPKDGDRLLRPVDFLERGTFEHAFGSDAAAPRNNDLLIDLPFRLHDRHAPRTWSFEGVYFSASRELTGAYVTHVTWDEQLPSPFCEVKVALRLDGAPSWDAEPANGPGLAGRLYLFDDPKEENQVLVRADRVELRVYLTFKPGAFYEDQWKRGPIVGAVRVHYRQPTQSLRREERSD